LDRPHFALPLHHPGFESEEIEPWHEDGEEWRRLKISFPDPIASHTKTQITHFGPDGLMRRHDYTVDILGGNTGANYVSGYRDFQGIKMPTTRRIYAYDQHMQKVPEPLLVSLDFGQLTFSGTSARLAGINDFTDGLPVGGAPAATLALDAVRARPSTPSSREAKRQSRGRVVRYVP
jgi:hypothetical protein